MSATSGAVTAAIARSSADFRTVLSIADELDAKPSEVRRALAMLESSGVVRRPVVVGSRYDDWYRLVSRGLTRQEKRARWRALVTFQSMRDNY